MKRVALLFVLAVLVPSVVLAWLAGNSLRDQHYILERQQSLLYQEVADGFAKEAQTVLDEEVRGFGLEVEAMLLAATNNLPHDFDEVLRSRWPLAEVGFVVSTNGVLLAPQATKRAATSVFLAANGRFLANQEVAEVYLNVGNLGQVLNQSLPQPPIQNTALWPNESPADPGQVPAQQRYRSKVPATRNVIPQQQQAALLNTTAELPQFDYNRSRLNPEATGFAQVVGETAQGSLARFVDNRLTVLFWHRSPRAADNIFGAQLALDRLQADLRELFRELKPELRSEVCVAVLDDTAKPVALSHAGFTANWKRPFVATEIGEALPHWEIAVYLLDPGKLNQAARTLKLTLGLLITLLLIAMVVGSWLIVSDLRRQLALARQKTDFVSNVSHELKTPLTSIRMFAELLAEGRVADGEKQRSYLHIITAEAARLTRLINNVLDFARLERGEKKYQFQPCDLAEVVRDTAETLRPHLEQSGFTFESDLPTEPCPITGDRDALAQVLVNLLSNAEKYAGDQKEIRVELRRRTDPLPFVEVNVLDRGLGVPRGCEAKIFEQFYRAHDALNSGIQGSGLGLTLARQIARAHGGDVAYEPREGGGSCFSLRLPLVGQASRLSPS
ncbi:MAG TPA: HAMP domain-containing sensor histidine kinase [Verrucomicrobiae bacterium]